MPTAEQYLAICNRCPFRQRPCGDKQPCACTADWIDIREHARSAHCPQNLYPVAPAHSAASIAHGVAGITKALTGVGGADAKLVEQRIQICKNCEHNKLSLGMAYKCELCGCFTWAKARNLSEKCPAGKWEAAGNPNGDARASGQTKSG